MTERLQKFLANKGMGSRREIESWIKAGRISVDGEVAELGCKVDGSERIEVDGKPVRKPKRESRPRVIIYHKPTGEICTRNDPEDRPTVFQALPRVLGARWVTVGRLDFNTSGLLIVTTDGELANRMMHPSTELERVYAVRALGDLSEQQLEQLTSGVALDDGEARFDRIEITDAEGANKSYLVTVSEGRNRIIRRMFEAVGCRVNRLMRISYGPVSLPRDIRPGKYREFSETEVEALRESLV